MPRAELGLEPIPESWHNVFFHEDQTKEYLASIGCTYVDQNCFLSGYYFGSRVLLPALLPEGQEGLLDVDPQRILLRAAGRGRFLPNEDRALYEGFSDRAVAGAVSRVLPGEHVLAQPPVKPEERALTADGRWLSTNATAMALTGRQVRGLRIGEAAGARR